MPVSGGGGGKGITEACPGGRGGFGDIINACPGFKKKKNCPGGRAGAGMFAILSSIGVYDNSLMYFYDT